MREYRILDWPYIIGLLLLPIAVLVIVLVAGWVDGLLRFHPDYFTSPYLEKYREPTNVLTDLEEALRQGDADSLKAIEGTRDTSSHLEPLPNVRFIIFWESDGKYTDYLFMDTKNYHRYMQHLKFYRGRYVRVPDGLYFYVDSGRWVRTFGPIAAIWWILVILFTAVFYIYRSMERFRASLFRGGRRL